MNQANIGARAQLRRIALAVALVAATTWCTSSMASQDDAQDHDAKIHHDHVRISGSPGDSVTVGHEFAFKPSAEDSDHRALMFAISHKPSWARFDTRTGELSGKPSASHVGTYRDIAIAASDGWRTAKLPEFALHVLPEPVPPKPRVPAPKPTPTPTPDPTIAGTPATSDVAGSAYSFQPTASGPSGLSLAFSVKNKPSWANFSIATGRLSGTPAATQAGTYADIIVSVSDGKASAALPGFSITVKPPGSTQPQPGSGSAVINWTPPTDNVNGTPLTNLAGVRIYYGTTESNLNHSVQLASNQTSYTISNLTAGVWYFGGVSVTTAGEQSPMSSIVGASIP